MLDTVLVCDALNTGKRMDDFGDWATCSECEEAVVAPWLPLTLRPVRSKHSELCYGAVFAWQGRPVLGWSVSAYRSFTEHTHSRAQMHDFAMKRRAYGELSHMFNGVWGMCVCHAG